MPTSILNDVKHALGLYPEDRAFDQDIILYINATFGTLTQLGIGPVVGFQINSENDYWETFFDDPRLNAVKSYVILCVKMFHSPPEAGPMIAVMERQKQEMEYRLNVVADYG